MKKESCGPATGIGQRVKFAFPSNGYTHDRQQAAEYLTEGSEYHVEAVEVDGWSTTLYLKEVPGVRFNSVLFSPA